MAGIIGAIFNSGIELGSALGIAVDASIETSIENKETDGLGFEHYKGRRDTFWWLLACCVLLAVSIVVFYRTGMKTPGPNAEQDANAVAEADDAGSIKTAGSTEKDGRFGEQQEKRMSIEEVPMTRAPSMEKPIEV